MDYKLSTTQQPLYNFSSSYNQENKNYSIQTSMKTQTAELIKNKPKQWEYKISNLPIIYDNSKNLGIPTKYSTNSRVIYGEMPKDQTQQALVTSSIPYDININSMPQPKEQIPLTNTNTQYKQISYAVNPSPLSSYLLQNNTNVYLNNELTPEIKPSSQLTPSYTSNFKNSSSILNKYDNKMEIEKSDSKLVVQKNVPTFNYQAVRTSNAVKQIASDSNPDKIQTYGKVSTGGNYLPSVNYPIYTTSTIPTITKSIINSKRPSVETNQQPKIRNNNGTGIQVLQASRVMTQTGGVNYLSMETVPKVLYDRCVNECKNWQTKYNQLYLKHMSLAASTMEPNSSELEHLRNENNQLKKQLIEHEEKKRQVTPHLSYKLNQLVNGLQESTIKQCMLLMERFKLECRQKF